MKYDRFDALILICVVALLGGSWYYSAKGATAEATRASGSKCPSASLFAELARARAQLDAGKSSKAAESLKLFISGNPDVADAHLLLARAYAAVEEYPAALHEYRAALALDPEYADKSSEKFVGTSIKKVLQHGWTPCEITVNPSSNDAAHKAAEVDARDILRMMSGGCQ